MKPAGILAAALVTLTGLPLVAQEAAAAAQSIAVTVATAPAKPSGVAADVPRVAAAHPRQRMFPVRAQLMGSLDSKSAKAGSTVELRTLETMRAANGTEIPKGTRIMGHVIQVEARRKGSENAAMAIQLDRAELKGGRSLAIRSAILSVTPPPDPSTANLLRNIDNMGGAMDGATQVMGGEHNGGLGAGNNTGLTVSGGMLQASPRQAEGLSSVADYGMQSPNETAARQPEATHGVIAIGAAAQMAHPTGVNGVMLAGDATGRLAGTFSATQRNVHLDGGTRLVLGLMIVE